MTVRLHDERTYDASPRALFELLTDPAFQEARSRHLGTLSARCERHDEGSTVSISVEETRDTGYRPHVYRTRFAVRWDREAMRARWELTRLGGPGDAHAHGTLAIEAVGDRSRVVLDGELEVRVRFFGRAIEEIAKRALGRERAEEARFIAIALRER